MNSPTIMNDFKSFTYIAHYHGISSITILGYPLSNPTCLHLHYNNIIITNFMSSLFTAG